MDRTGSRWIQRPGSLCLATVDLLAALEGAEDYIKGIQGLSQVISEIVIRKVFVEGRDVLSWYEMHTTVASPVVVANWLHVEGGKIDTLRVAFDARELAP